MGADVRRCFDLHSSSKRNHSEKIERSDQTNASPCWTKGCPSFSRCLSSSCFAVPRPRPLFLILPEFCMSLKGRACRCRTRRCFTLDIRFVIVSLWEFSDHALVLCFSFQMKAFLKSHSSKQPMVKCGVVHAKIIPGHSTRLRKISSINGCSWRGFPKKHVFCLLCSCSLLSFSYCLTPCPVDLFLYLCAASWI